MSVGARNFPKCPRPLQKPVNRQFLEKKLGKPPNVVRARKLCDANVLPMSLKIPENWPVAPSYRQNGFVGWVPNRQNRSPTDETAPSPTPKRPYLGSQGHVGPQTLGPHVACDQIWSAGVSPRADPKTGKIHFLVFLARFGAQTGPQNFSQSPRPAKTIKPRIARKSKTTQCCQSKKNAQRDCSSAEPKISRKLPAGAELRLEQFFVG